MSKRILPSKEERHKHFGSVPPIKGTKPTKKEDMPDLQNTPKDFLFSIQQVGVTNVKHPIMIAADTIPSQQTTIANITMTTALVQERKGINMSRLTEALHDRHQSGWTVTLETLEDFAKELADRMEQPGAIVSMTFPWYFERQSPIMEKPGLIHADVTMKAEVSNTEKTTFTVGMTAAVATLCPCSKEISEYSAHNQRGIVTVEADLKADTDFDQDWKVTLLDAIESNASAMLYPVLKRPDEKRVTEQAYENPRFVEDLTRLIAADLYEWDALSRFSVECRNEESIHLHDAYAKIHVDCEN